MLGLRLGGFGVNFAHCGVVVRLARNLGEHAFHQGLVAQISQAAHEFCALCEFVGLGLARHKPHVDEVFDNIGFTLGAFELRRNFGRNVGSGDLDVLIGDVDAVNPRNCARVDA